MEEPLGTTSLTVKLQKLETDEEEKALLKILKLGVAIWKKSFLLMKNSARESWENSKFLHRYGPAVVYGLVPTERILRENFKGGIDRGRVKKGWVG